MSGTLGGFDHKVLTLSIARKFWVNPRTWWAVLSLIWNSIHILSFGRSLQCYLPPINRLVSRHLWQVGEIYRWNLVPFRLCNGLKRISFQIKFAYHSSEWLPWSIKPSRQGAPRPCWLPLSSFWKPPSPYETTAPVYLMSRPLAKRLIVDTSSDTVSFVAQTNALPPWP